jgi:hypothetical protein
MDNTLKKIKDILTGLLSIIKIFIPDKQKSLSHATEIEKFAKTIKKTISGVKDE